MIVDDLEKFSKEILKEEDIQMVDEGGDSDPPDMEGDITEGLYPLQGFDNPDPEPQISINDLWDEPIHKGPTFKRILIDVPSQGLFNGYIALDGRCFKSEDYYWEDFAPKVIKEQFNDVLSQIAPEFNKSNLCTKAEWFLMEVLGYAKVQTIKEGHHTKLEITSRYDLTEQQYDTANHDDPSIWAAKKLYLSLQDPQYSKRPFEKRSLGEGMSVISQTMYGYWKQQYLLDDIAKKAYEVIGLDRCFKFMTQNDIDWDSLSTLPKEMIDRAKLYDAHFPFSIGEYHNGEATLSWQINPDGRYYMDEDGYGMTDDKEITLHGTIDRRGKIIKKFGPSLKVRGRLC